VRTIELTRRWGRGYFALQAVAGAVWWVAVFTIPFVRQATLGDLPPVLVAVVDIPLFVVASALVAAGIRRAVWVVVPWTLLLTGGLTVYATVTAEAGWGVLLMLAATAGSVGAGMLVLFGRIPTERMLVGPLGFRDARPGSASRHVATTAVQLVVFWGLFLVVFPLIIAAFERRWGVGLAMPAVIVAIGVAVLVLASALGLWSAFAMSTRGAGSPLPAAATTRLVSSGPYRFVRNPMAVAGIAQGAAVGLILQSWLVVVYAIAGSLIWNWFVRPVEEADLAAKFGDEYRAYRERVRCWIPRFGGVR
jgi:protein-S-isoprenylcysteine O-methyltransferase Ste14